MQFRFDANQDFQVRAIEAAADPLEGQTRLSAAVKFAEGTLNLAA